MFGDSRINSVGGVDGKLRDENRQHEKALKMLKTLVLNMNMTCIF